MAAASASVASRAAERPQPLLTTAATRRNRCDDLAAVRAPATLSPAGAAASCSCSCSWALSGGGSVVPPWVDNAAAQAAAAIDVEYAHYELREVVEDREEQNGRRRSRPRAALSVPAAVAVVARGKSDNDAESPSQDWRAGLQVLYHAPYIEPSQDEFERKAAEAAQEQQQQHSLEWRWVGGVRRPPPPEAQAESPTLDEARQGVLEALHGRACAVLHGADHDLRALGLLQLLPGSGPTAATTSAVFLDTAALPPLAHPRSGAPVSLRRLAREHLGRDIQQKMEGLLHDPLEDAAAALDLWLDVAWPRALLDRQAVVVVVAGGDGGVDGGSGSGSIAAQLVEALEATMAREVAQARRRRRGKT